MQSKGYTSSKTVKSSGLQPISGPRQGVTRRKIGGQYGGGGGGGGEGGSSMTRTIEMTRSFGMNSAPGASSSYVHNGVNNLMDGREKERNELQQLNDRFSNYIDKVKHLEDENRRLGDELAELKEQWGKETARIKLQYDGEMEQLRRSLDAAESGKAQTEMRLNSVEDLILEAQAQLTEANDVHSADKETIEKMTSQASDYEAEIQSLRRRLAGLEEEKGRDEKESARLKEELDQIKKDLDKESMEHVTAQNDVQSLRDQIEFLKKVYESEVKELAALAYKDTAESKEFWRNEMAQALRDIQSEYDRKLDSLQSDMEGQYSIKIQEFRSHQSRETSETSQYREENSRLRQEMADIRSHIPELEARNNELERMLEALRREMEERNREFDMEKNRLRKELANKRSELESILIELQLLLDAKLNLEFEIMTYRKMLEGEEIRVNKKSSGGLQASMGGGSGGGMFSSGGGGGGGGGGSMFSAGGGGGGMISSSGGGRNMDNMDGVITRSSASQFHAAPQSKTTVTQVVKGEMSAKTSFQRTAKGNVTIQECSPDGKFIVLENTGKSNEDLTGYRIHRDTDNGRSTVRYDLPSNTILGCDSRSRLLKIWSRGNRPQGSNDLECSDSSWGVGSQIVTSLFNSKNEEKATHTQRTVYQM